MTYKAILAIFCFCLSTPLFADPIIEREGSQLTIKWRSNLVGSWKVTSQLGRVCASGRMTSGENTVHFNKINSTVDLNFSTMSSNPFTNTDIVQIPAINKLSTLKKPENSVVFYQLPPRTYLARGMGKDKSGALNDLTIDRLREIKNLGVDYLWVTGIQEHASVDQTDVDVVKGDAGSYYAIYDNWDVSQFVGGLREFESFIERAHQVGLRVMMDFVANHTARVHRTDVLCKQELDFGSNDDDTEFFSGRNNYFYLEGVFTPPKNILTNGSDGIFDSDIFTPGIQFESPTKVTGNDIASSFPQNHDWFETVKLNYGWNFKDRVGVYSPAPKTWNQMVDISRYWLKKGVDGFRVDYAHAVPLEFWEFYVGELRKVNPEVFLLAEAYEKDERMKVPGFTYQALLNAGFDSVYNSGVYWALHSEASNPGNVRAANAHNSPAMRREILQKGYRLTHYMENHDEERVASRQFAPWIADRDRRANIGLAYSAYAALLPGHMLIHGGQELQEDASIYGEYAGDNGRTSIFDFVYQPFTRYWLYGGRPEWMTLFRNRYKTLLHLKHLAPFNSMHSLAKPTFIDLDGANYYKEQSQYIASYIRYKGNDKYLVVLNSDPFNSHKATVHFTLNNYGDSIGALSALGIENSQTRYRFVEVFDNKGWEPSDPNIQGKGIPGYVLFKSGGVPSGLFLGDIAPGTTLIFRISEHNN